MTSTEIIKKQNEIALAEFKRNYNKSEAERVAIELIEGRAKEVVELEKQLQSQVKEGYTVTVSNTGMIRITKRDEELSAKYGNVEVTVKVIHPTIRLPYAYVMGKKVSKKAMLEFAEYCEI